MGRLTKGSKRTRIQDYMKKMRDTFRAARAQGRRDTIQGKPKKKTQPHPSIKQ